MDLLRLMADFMRRLAVIRTTEEDRNPDVQENLHRLLDVGLVHAQSWDGTDTGVVNVCDTMANETAFPVMVAWMSEFGAGSLRACVSKEVSPSKFAMRFRAC